MMISESGLLFLGHPVCTICVTMHLTLCTDAGGHVTITTQSRTDAATSCLV